MLAARTLRRQLIRELRNDAGVSLVEFAIVALPITVFLLGILEVGLLFWGSYELDNATLAASRLIRTGQAQTNGIGQAGIVAQICSQVAILSNCTGTLRVNVQNFPDFAAVTSPTPTGSNGNLLPSFPYQPGGPSTVNLMTSYYEFPLIPLPGISLLSNLADGNRLLQSSAVFRTEPYP